MIGITLACLLQLHQALHCSWWASREGGIKGVPGWCFCQGLIFSIGGDLNKLQWGSSIYFFMSLHCIFYLFLSRESLMSFSGNLTKGNLLGLSAFSAVFLVLVMLKDKKDHYPSHLKLKAMESEQIDKNTKRKNTHIDTDMHFWCTSLQQKEQFIRLRNFITINSKLTYPNCVHEVLYTNTERAHALHQSEVGNILMLIAWPYGCSTCLVQTLVVGKL